MSGFWYIVFGSLPIMIASIVMWVISSKKSNKYWSIYIREQGVAERQAKAKISFWDGWDIASQVVFVISLLVTFGFTLAAWIGPLEGRRAVAYFKQQSEYVEMAVVNGDVLENVAITHTIIEQNAWLVDAKARLEAYGIFSAYYGSDLEELEPIVIERD